MKNPFKSKPRSAVMTDVAGKSLSRVIGAEPEALRAHAFGKGINHIKPFLGSALHNFTLVAPVLLLAALVTSVMAVNQAAAFISAFTKEIKSAEVNRMAPLIDKKPLVGADYQSAANIIAKNNSAVQVSLSRARTAIVISVKDPALLPEFMYALTTIQSYRQGVAWNAGKLCLNKCEGGNAASAEITGYTQSIQFKGLRPDPT
ncbi:MAG: hypothetical protein V4695_00040 [Pseudomonadota bacterium]